MKKRKLRIVALMLLVALIIPCYANAGDGEAKKDKMLTDEEQYELMLKQAPAMAAYEQLMAAWINENGDLVYPDAFGGFYHTDDFKLAIKVVDNDERFIEEAKDAVEDPSILEFVGADISLKGLLSLKSEIKELMTSVTFSVGINQIDSTVDVMVHDTSSSSMRKAPVLSTLVMDKHVKLSFNNPSVKMQAITYHSGKLIYDAKSSLSSAVGQGTLGWYGTYSFPGKGRLDCFLTAGHVQILFERNGSDMYFGNSKVFSKAYYPDGLYNQRFCFCKAGDDRTENNWPKGNSCGDFAVMACNTIELPDTDIAFSNQIQMNSYTVNVTDYLGKNIQSEILQKQKDPQSDSSIRSYLNAAFPQNTKLFKGLGVNKIVSSYGTVNDVFKECHYDNYGVAPYLNEEAWGSVGDIDGCIEIKPSSTTHQFAQDGDSGAPVFFFNSGNNATLVGIICGGCDGYSYITPTTVLISYGFIPYVG